MSLSHEDSHELSLSDYFYMVKRYKKAFIVTLLLGVFAGFLYKTFSPNKNNAVAKIKLNAKDKKAIESKNANYSEYHSNALSSSALMLTGKEILYVNLLQVLNEKGVEGDSDSEKFPLVEIEKISIVELKSMISVQQDYGNLDMLTVSVSSSLSAEAVKFICASFVRVFIFEINNFISNDKREQLNTVHNMINIEKEKINDVNKKMREQILKNVKDGVQSGFSNDPNRMAKLIMDYENQIQSTKLRKNELSGMINQMKEELGLKSIALEKVHWLDSSDPTHQKLEELNFQKEELIKKYRPSNPSVLKIEHQIQAIKEKLKSEHKEEGMHYIKVGKLKSGMVSDLIKYNSEFKATDKRIESIKSSISELHQKIVNGSTSSGGSQKLKAQKELSEALLKDLMLKTQQIRISIDSSQNQVKVFQNAKSDNASNISLAGYCSSILAMSIFCALMVCYYLFDNEKTVIEFRDLKRHFSYPALANIPNLNPNDLVVQYDNPYSQSNEAYGLLKNNLEFNLSSDGSNCVLFSSVNDHEGKSLAAANCALSYAIDGNNVLLISCDMRKAQDYEFLLGEKENEGRVDFEEYLKGDIDLEKVYQKTFLENLFVVPTITQTKNSTALLKSDKFKSFIEMNAKEFDMIILDTPSAARYIDAVICSNAVKDIVMMIDCESTEIASVKKVITHFEQNGARVRGVVLNRSVS